jgi:hypothetical protein
MIFLELPKVQSCFSRQYYSFLKVPLEKNNYIHKSWLYIPLTSKKKVSKNHNEN